MATRGWQREKSYFRPQVLIGAFLGLELLIWLGVLNDYWTLTLMTMGINIILAVSLNLINGFTGQFSLGHAGFMAVGGYTAGVISIKWAPGPDQGRNHPDPGEPSPGRAAWSARALPAFGQGDLPGRDPPPFLPRARGVAWRP